MKTGILHLCGALGIAALMFSSCSKEMSTSPDQNSSPVSKDSVNVNYEISVLNPTYRLTPDASGRLAATIGDPSLAKGTTGFDITWDTATARLREIRLEAKRGPDEVEFKLKTDRQVNLKNIPVILGAIRIPTGTYQQVKVYARVEGDKNNPAVKLIGFVTFDGKKIPVEIILSGKIELKATGKDVVVTKTGIDWKGSLKISMDLVLEKLQLGDFQAAFSKGKLQISVNVNAGLHDKVVNSFENSMSVEHLHN
ncbi:MAG TPA: hypothetical protein VM802_10035 [Chitinophaga sp.]|uniref:hypothetical protein n=1 Tax=Chitinophaga sp. TaxID=1869181 RepID=UPI002B6C0F7C|nr:hypothetical protein [Chitinophaga sp.]HVI45203.1 hypothetical protein [Chitinophaga sp.]